MRGWAFFERPRRHGPYFVQPFVCDVYLITAVCEEIQQISGTKELKNGKFVVLQHYKTCEEIEIFYRIVAQLLHGVGSEIRNDVGGRQPGSSSDVSICTFVVLRCQYLYFCKRVPPWRSCSSSDVRSGVRICTFVPSKQENWVAAAWRGERNQRSHRRGGVWAALLRQYLYFFTNKASKLST